MPIYAYKCDSCGFAKDVLQKLSDAPLSECPSCGELSYKKQLTAAGFQLKGSGWYATDFKGGNTPPPASGEEKAPGAVEPAVAAKTGDPTGGQSDSSKSEGKSESKKPDAPVVKKPDPAPAASSRTQGPAA